MTEYKYATKSVHLAYHPDTSNHYSVGPPIGLSTTFQQSEPSSHREYRYTRVDNPSRTTLENGLALLEGCKYALAYSSGSSAISAVVQLLNQGDHIVSDNIMYAGRYSYCENIIKRMGITTTYVDATNPQNVEKAIRENTKLVFVESPTNPVLTLCDIARIAQIVRKHPGVILAVDNTFLTPCFQKPLQLGADIALYSITKYMNGHDDVCMGSLCVNDEDLYQRLKYLHNTAGLNPSPFDCYLVFRSLKTLPLCMEKHQKNSLEVARFLEAHPCIEKVMHPWLPSHPQHELAKKQSTGHSGMLAFYVKGDFEKTSDFLKNLKLVDMAGSLGGVGSIAEIPAVFTHTSIPEELRQALGVTKNLIRFSIGIEDAEDIITDLDQALKAAFK